MKEDLAMSVQRCSQLWLETLKHFKQERKLLPTESLSIAQAIQRYGVEAVELALLGIRFEKGSKDYDPSQHVYLARIFRPDRFERFVGLGAQEINRKTERLREVEELRLEIERDKAIQAQPISQEEVAKVLGMWSKKRKDT